jgi:hypothetical protein
VARAVSLLGQLFLFSTVIIGLRIARERRIQTVLDPPTTLVDAAPTRQSADRAG